MHTKRILAHFFVVAGRVCKGSKHDATLKIEAVLSLLHEARNQLNLKEQNFFACHTRKTVAVTYPLAYADLTGVLSQSQIEESHKRLIVTKAEP